MSYSTPTKHNGRAVLFTVAELLVLTSRPWAMTLGWRDGYISKITYKLGELGQSNTTIH